VIIEAKWFGAHYNQEVRFNSAVKFVQELSLTGMTYCDPLKLLFISCNFSYYTILYYYTTILHFPQIQKGMEIISKVKMIFSLNFLHLIKQNEANTNKENENIKFLSKGKRVISC